MQYDVMLKLATRSYRDVIHHNSCLFITSVSISSKNKDEKVLKRARQKRKVCIILHKSSALFKIVLVP